jgi:amidase
MFTDTRNHLLPMLRQVVSADALRSMELNDPFISSFDLAGYSRALADRARLLRDWTQFMERYPLIVGPVSTARPFAVGDDVINSERSREIMDSQRLIVAISLLGLPAAVVPVGVADGLPQAVQIIGRPFREDLCLDAAEAIERALGRITPIDPR